MLRLLTVIRDLVIYFAIFLIRKVFRSCIVRSRYKRPEAFLVKEQYGCLNNILSYFGIDDIGYIHTINLGFENAKYTSPDLDKLFEGHHPSTRLQLQLYHYVATGGNQHVDLEDKEVLEIGCGRGGGTSFIAKTLKPKQLTGVDLSSEGIAYCEKKWNEKNLRFLVGDSQNLPFPDASFDVVLNVESSHCYPKFVAFLMQVSRVLKDGGKFCYCDISNSKAVADLRMYLPRLGLSIVEEEIITPQVLASLEKMSVARDTALKRFPFFLRPALANVIGQPGSATYNNLQSNEWLYVRLVCERVARS